MNFLNWLTIFTPNEMEAEFYTGIKINNEKDAKVSAKKLIDMGIKSNYPLLVKKDYFIQMA